MNEPARNFHRRLRPRPARLGDGALTVAATAGCGSIILAAISLGFLLGGGPRSAPTLSFSFWALPIGGLALAVLAIARARGRPRATFGWVGLVANAVALAIGYALALAAL